MVSMSEGLQAFATTTALTALPASGNLSGRYVVSSDQSRETGSLTVTGDTVIYIKSGVTLTVTGGAGSGTTGGSAGITVPSGKTLVITGPGTLVATGGKGADGATGGKGENAAFTSSGGGGSGGNGGGSGTTYTNSQSVKNLTSTNGETVALTATWNNASVTLPTPTRIGYTFAVFSLHLRPSANGVV